MQNSRFSCVAILAGGIGERLWPLSTKEHPKQFIKAGEHSFFQMSLLRALALRPEQAILVITRRELTALAVDQCRELADSCGAEDRLYMADKLRILPEPMAKHTAAAIFCACRLMSAEYPEKDHSLLALTSDHIIEPLEAFLGDCQRALAVSADRFVCFGIKPAYPATGFGYIQTGTKHPEIPAVFEIASFQEKPDTLTAQSYLTEGNYWWNSGMFAFRGSLFVREIQTHTPEIAQAFAPLAGQPDWDTSRGVKVLRHWQGLAEAYGNTPAIAVDRAVVEKTRFARCVLATFGWTDIGNWDEFARTIPAPKENCVAIQSGDCYVHSDIPVALCGVSGIMVVIRDGKALVMRKGTGTLVQEAVKQFSVYPD